MSDPDVVDFCNRPAPVMGNLPYTAPEILRPEVFGLENGGQTEKSDIYAFGMTTYEVSATDCASIMVTNDSVQVITQLQPFPQETIGEIIENALKGVGPKRPEGTNKWLSDDVWDIISRCLYPKWDARPDAGTVRNTLNKANSEEPQSGRTSIDRRSGASCGYRPLNSAKLS